MPSVRQSILNQAKLLPEGTILAPKAFLHLGKRASVDQAFTRLTKSGELIRVERGAYVLPFKSRFGVRPPSSASVIRSLGEVGGETIVQSGASAANQLGLSLQVPLQATYLTSGRGRTVSLGSNEIRLKHAPAWLLRLGTTPSGEALRAIAWMGENRVRESVAAVKSVLPHGEWKSLVAARASFPDWIAREVGAQAADA